MNVRAERSQFVEADLSRAKLDRARLGEQRSAQGDLAAA